MKRSRIGLEEFKEREKFNWNFYRLCCDIFILYDNLFMEWKYIFTSHDLKEKIMDILKYNWKIKQRIGKNNWN